MRWSSFATWLVALSVSCVFNGVEPVEAAREVTPLPHPSIMEPRE